MNIERVIREIYKIPESVPINFDGESEFRWILAMSDRSESHQELWDMFSEHEVFWGRLNYAAAYAGVYLNLKPIIPDISDYAERLECKTFKLIDRFKTGKNARCVESRSWGRMKEKVNNAIFARYIGDTKYKLMTESFYYGKSDAEIAKEYGYNEELLTKDLNLVYEALGREFGDILIELEFR